MKIKDFFRLANVSDYENDPCFSTRSNEAVSRSCELILTVFSRLADNFMISGIGILFTFGFVLLLCDQIKDPSKLNGDVTDSFVFWVLSGAFTCLLSFIGLVITVYWNLDSVYGRKWTVITEKFYEFDLIKDRALKEHCLTNLWIDAFHLKIWADPGLNILIYDGIRTALLAKHKEKDCRCPMTDEVMAFLKKGYLDKEVVLSILYEYLSILSNRGKRVRKVNRVLKKAKIKRRRARRNSQSKQAG